MSETPSERKMPPALPPSVPALPAAMSRTEHEQGSERPVAPRPRSSHVSEPKDPLWQTVANQGAELARVFPRLEAVEKLALVAHEIASEARTKVDTLAAAQIQASKDFTAAVKAQTDALKTFGTSIDDVKAIGRWLVILICIMSLATILSLVITLTHH